VFGAISEIGSVYQAKRCWSQQLLFLPFTGSLFDKGRRIPFAEKNSVPLTDQPLSQKCNLCAFSRAINTLYHKQPPWICM